MDGPGVLIKPRMRGVLHELAFFASLVAGPLLIVTSPAEMRGSTFVYAACLTGLFGASALYHRPTWKPRMRMWLRKLDHSMIFMLIAGTFTPFAYALNISWSRFALAVVWIGAIGGALLGMLPFSAPKPLVVIPYIALGWFGVLLLPAMWNQLGPLPPSLLILGGAFYTLGAIAYARRRPNPRPGVFGYHEVFHAFVVIAGFVHYSAIAIAAHT